jgi:hypothetical protein
MHPQLILALNPAASTRTTKNPSDLDTFAGQGKRRRRRKKQQ